ncbi:UDP-glucose 4-epimerase [Roseovarius litoreus]|uniref:UDP-glucose 4-epimerase n=1 Tax=Roseovarius litoreus TaxID=1155722 RepID=A0A1M7B7V6_9RHOB|nr:NAD(P)-dependent oxidoreductase [Roseovarius litoreus]SHL51070.1 UDP-glucose 4-epimerase [Roseovarius litoreus]
MSVDGCVAGGKVAVTGASGFIGRYLCEDLEAAGYRPLRLGRGAPQAAVERQTDYSRDSLARALEGAEAVVHLAGRRMTRQDDPDDITPFQKPNVAVIGDLVAAARQAGVRRIVLASTIAVYGRDQPLPCHEGMGVQPINAYATSKLMAEAHLGMLTRAGGPSSVALRLASVYGHGEKDTPVMMRFVDQAIAGETIMVTGHPDTAIDQIYVRDATAAIIAALRHPEVTGICNIGGGAALPVRRIAETVNVIHGNMGNLIDKTDSKGRADCCIMALDRAARDLGWRPAYDLEAGLQDMRKVMLACGAIIEEDMACRR